MSDSYLQHWNIKSNVFASPDDLGNFFLSETTTKILRKLYVFCEQGGCNISLSSPDGYGKTHLANYLYYKFPVLAYDVCVMSLLSQEIGSHWLMPRLAEFFGIHVQPAFSKEFLSSLIIRQIDDLSDENKKLIILVDGAEMIASEGALEEINTLNKLQVLARANISFIFFGNDTWQNFIEKSSLRSQFKYIAKLTPLSLAETKSYFRSVLESKGLAADVFSQQAIETIHMLTEGVLAPINAIGENCLVESFLLGKNKIDVELVLEATKSTGQFFSDARIHATLEKIKGAAPETFNSESTEIRLANLFKKEEAG